jgi:hypothetical protein
MDGEYDRLVTDYDGYRTRKIEGTEPPAIDQPTPAKDAPDATPDLVAMLEAQY